MADSFEYPSTDIENPYGVNGLPSLASFYQRSLYKERCYIDNDVRPIDYWYDKKLYGRVDDLQSSIIVKDDYLKQIISSDRQNLFAINFVVDAFEDLVEHLRVAGFLGQISPTNTSLHKITAKRAWISYKGGYQSYIRTLFDVFANGYGKIHDSKILGFKSFSAQYSKFLQNSLTIMPLTRTNYILTTKCSPLTSGLVIEISGINHGDDSAKVKTFIEDINFEFYQKAAKKYGFIIDKNAPWRLTADLFSEAIQEYMYPYGLSKENLFDEAYNYLYKTDLSDLKDFFLTSYNSYVNIRPVAKKRIPRGPRCPGKTKIQKIYRYQQGSSNDIPDKKWIELYFLIRHAEAGYPIGRTGPKLRNIMRIYHSKGMEAALTSINRIYRMYIYPVNYSYQPPLLMTEKEKDFTNNTDTKAIRIY